MGKASLNNQFFNILQQNTELGRDKHSDKALGDNGDHTVIYSLADREALGDTSKQLVNYIKDNYSNVKMIKDITPNMIQNFLDSKINTSQFNINKIYSHIGKIERLAEKTFPVQLEWKVNLEKPESLIVKLRDIPFSPEHWKMVETYINSKSIITDTEKGIILGRDFGLRVESITNILARDVTFNADGSVNVYISHDKGGRDRTLTSSNTEVVDRWKQATEGKNPGDKLVPVKPDSINRQLDRIEERLGIREDYKSAKTGMHSIRKMWAKEQYIHYREAGIEKQEALNKVSEALGHGANRNSLMETYIGKDTIEEY